jgi:hypothetical protein
MRNLKKILLAIYRKFCKKFNYFTFSESEKKGFYSRGFWFKIIRSQKYFSYENGLTVRGVRFDKIDNDPKGLAVSKLFPLTQSSEKEFSEILYKNYVIESKMSAAQILGLDSNHESSKYPIWAMVYPWDGESINDRFERYPNALIKNRTTHGLLFDSSDHKHIIEKSYSFEAAEIQAKQYIQLLKKIQQYGFIEGNSLPHILILKKGDRWKWLVGVEGNHRAYINHLLKKPSLFSEVIDIVDILKASKWKNVKNGLYTLDEAKYIFQLVFEGKVRTRGLI